MSSIQSADLLHLTGIYCSVFTGTFEVSVNGTLVYSKLSTMAFPDFKNVTDIVSDAANGKDVVPVSKQQPIECIIL
jgi:selenoprotein W-related protein